MPFLFLYVTSGTCAEDWLIFQNQCYRYFTTKKNWTDARTECQSHGANLTSIHSADEDEFVDSLHGTSFVSITVKGLTFTKKVETRTRRTIINMAGERLHYYRPRYGKSLYKIQSY